MQILPLDPERDRDLYYEYLSVMLVNPDFVGLVQGEEPERGGAGGEAQEKAAQAAQKDPGEQDAQQGHEEPHPHRPGQAPSVQGCASGSAWIRINLSSWVRIRIQEAKNDPQI